MHCIAYLGLQLNWLTSPTATFEQQWNSLLPFYTRVTEEWRKARISDCSKEMKRWVNPHRGSVCVCLASPPQMSIASIRDRSAPALCHTLPYTWARTNVHPTCFVLPGPHSDLRAQLQLQLRPLHLLLLLLLLFHLLLLLLWVVCSPSRMQSRVSNGACRKIPSARYDQARGRTGISGKHGDISSRTERESEHGFWRMAKSSQLRRGDKVAWQRPYVLPAAPFTAFNTFLLLLFQVADKVTDLWGEVYRLADSAYRLQGVVLGTIGISVYGGKKESLSGLRQAAGGPRPDSEIRRSLIAGRHRIHSTLTLSSRRGISAL